MQFHNRFVVGIVRSVFLGLFALSPLIANAQWTAVAPNLLAPVGIEGGCITTKSGLIWAGSHELWMSSDFGTTWTKRSPGLVDKPDRFKAIHFYDDMIGAAVTHYGYVFLTKDQGLTWQQTVRTSSATGVAILSPPENIIVAAGTTGEICVTHDGGLNWRTTKLGSSIADVRPLLGSSAYILNGFTPPGDTSEMHLMRTTDYGDTWTMMPGVLDFDTYSFDVDPCNPSVIYVANEDGSTTRDSVCEIFRSTDWGVTWQAFGARSVTKGNPRHFYSGSIWLNPVALFVQTVSDGVLRSTDLGASWKNIGGPNVTYDTRLLCAVNANLIVAADNNGTIWRTRSSGGDSLTIGSQFELLRSLPSELFATDSLRVCDSPVVSSIQLLSNFCKTPKIVAQSITGADSLDYILIRGVGDSLTGSDSVLISFKPKAAGDRHGYYTITLEDGTMLSFPLKGYGRGLKFVESTTLDATTDTIGGYVAVPLSLSGLDRIQDIGLVVKFEPSMTYLGSFTNDGTRIDLPGEVWQEGARLAIPADKLRLDSASGYAYFAVYPRRGPCYQVSFDSLTILDESSKCEYVLGAGIQATVCPPKGCGIMIITDFMLQGVIPNLLLQPNPTSGKLTITSTETLGASEVTIFDNTGRTVYRQILEVIKDGRYPLDLSHLADGMYVATIVSPLGTAHQRIHIMR
jgi:photosystem II stability/assembly factor-like uncharacterized protein